MLFTLDTVRPRQKASRRRPPLLRLALPKRLVSRLSPLPPETCLAVAAPSRLLCSRPVRTTLLTP